MKSSIESVFFDLDGTLIDTAPDLAFALNRVRLEHGKPALHYPEARQLMTNGSTVLISHSFGVGENDHEFHTLRKKFLAYYEEKLRHRSYVFHPFRDLLHRLNQQRVPWGIVTNKPAKFTQAVIHGLHIPIKEQFVISGDTAARPKPHPEPVELLCQRLQVDPTHCLLVGDSNNDILAGRQAGAMTALALWGYIPQHIDSAEWQADYRFKTPLDCTAMLQRWLLR